MAVVRALSWLTGWREVPAAELIEAQDEARVEVRRAIRRANHLWSKASRLPAGSNGHKKAKRDAKMIAQGAYDLAVKVGIEREFFRT